MQLWRRYRELRQEHKANIMTGFFDLTGGVQIVEQNGPNSVDEAMTVKLIPNMLWNLKFKMRCNRWKNVDNRWPLIVALIQIVTIGYYPDCSLSCALISMALTCFVIATMIGCNHNQPIFVICLMPFLNGTPNFANLTTDHSLQSMLSILFQSPRHQQPANE